MKDVIIFGSSGSIGKSALRVIAADRKNFKVRGLCVNQDIISLKRQIERFRPSAVCIRDEKQADKIKKVLAGKRIAIFKGESGLEEFSRIPSDISVMAIAGISCLKPLLLNLKYTKRVALANKESIVAAGSLVFEAARRSGVQIVPVDSEINALYQLIGPDRQGIDHRSIRRVYLTASGGALAGYRRKDLAAVTPKKVLAHPTWKMGPRITVDSATMVNKAFEVVETHYFFDLAYTHIDIVIHKESFVHALVEFVDNTLSACMYAPDMRTPIAHALYYPERFASNRDVNFRKPFSCSFKPLLMRRFPLLTLVLEAATRADNGLVVLNACDEVLIEHFLRKKISFKDMHKVMQFIFRRYLSQKIRTIDDVFFWDLWSRVKTRERIEKL